MVTNTSTSIAMGNRRPATISVAVFLAVGIQLGSLPFLFAPGAGGIPVFAIAIGIMAGLLTLLGAWAMWNLRRWGAILALSLSAINTLTAIPGFFDPPSGWILAELIIFVPLSVIDMVLIALPANWRAYQQQD